MLFLLKILSTRLKVLVLAFIAFSEEVVNQFYAIDQVKAFSLLKNMVYSDINGDECFGAIKKLHGRCRLSKILLFVK